jgi:Bacterial PH domain
MTAFHLESDAVPRRFRSPGQFYALIGFGLLATMFGLIGAAQVAYTTGKVIEAATAVMVGGGIVATAARAALFAGDDGVTIRNPLGRTKHIPWSEVAGFSIGKYKLLGAVCLVELRDGSSVHASAIQIPHASRNPANSREGKMIEELNRLLAAHRNT